MLLHIQIHLFPIFNKKKIMYFKKNSINKIFQSPVQVSKGEYGSVSKDSTGEFEEFQFGSPMNNNANQITNLNEISQELKPIGNPE